MQGGQWSDLPRRFLTVSIGVPLVISILSNRIGSYVFFQGVHALCTYEWTKMIPALHDSKKDDEHQSSSIPIAVKLFPIISVSITCLPQNCVTTCISLVAALLYLFSYLERDHGREKVAQRFYHMIHGLLYLTVAFHNWMILSQKSFPHTIFVLMTVWNCDTGALLAGRICKMIFKSQDIVGDIIKRNSVGKKCVEVVKSISPAKSITGFCGGICLGTWTAWCLPMFMFRCSTFLKGYGFFINSSVDIMDLIQRNDGTLSLFDFEAIFWIEDVVMRRFLVGIVLSLFAIFGDLVESAVKRNAGTKDSGKLLPGHGGALDRFDSTFFAVEIYLLLFSY